MNKHFSDLRVLNGVLTGSVVILSIIRTPVRLSVWTNLDYSSNCNSNCLLYYKGAPSGFILGGAYQLPSK